MDVLNVVAFLHIKTNSYAPGTFMMVYWNKICTAACHLLLVCRSPAGGSEHRQASF